MNGRQIYRLTHWGLGGKGDRVLRVADPFNGQLVELGELVSLVYRTEKLGDGLSEYEHDFKAPLPVLAFNKGGLVICGGRYRVGVRGIVG